MRQFRRFSIAGGHCYPLLEGWGWGEAALPKPGHGAPRGPWKHSGPISWELEPGTKPSHYQRGCQRGKEKYLWLLSSHFWSFTRASHRPNQPGARRPGSPGTEACRGSCDTQQSRGTMKCDMGTCRPQLHSKYMHLYIHFWDFFFDNS